MRFTRQAQGRWIAGTRWVAAWLVLLAVTGTLLVRTDIATRRAGFQNDARTAHRLLGQRAAQHDAILSTLVLLDAAPAADDPARRLPALYPQVLQVRRRTPEAEWPDADLARAEAVSRLAARPAVAALDPVAMHYDLVLAGNPGSFAMRIAIEQWVPWSEWPFARSGAVTAELILQAQVLLLQPGTAQAAWQSGVTPGFVFEKVLDTPSQPFVLRLRRTTGPADWPWQRLGALAATNALMLAALALVLGQHAARRRAEQLLRLARRSRLDTLGELAAGMAHELNQPLTAVIASTRAASRLLDDDPLPQATLREALDHAVNQARRAADVVARLRRLVERPGGAEAVQTVSLNDAVRSALALLQPELQRLGVQPAFAGTAVWVRADPVALDQILHNLLNNALQAMAAVPAGQRMLRVWTSTQDPSGLLCLRDGGPGLAPQVLDHLFEPFHSTRADGLGLGLSLCESLAVAMGGALSGQNVRPHGAEFLLALPLARS
ncbi:MAG: ATP-binding protein [Burkholderiales bacterium]